MAEQYFTLSKKEQELMELFWDAGKPLARAEILELAASRAAKPGDVVILSPACASFDKFKNFAERGAAFKKIIYELESTGK